MICYDRAPSENLKGLFTEGGFLRSLVGGLRPRSDFDSIPFDVQFRENDAVVIYCGLTQVARIRFAEAGRVMAVDSIDVYAKQPAAQKLMREWDLVKDKRNEFERELAHYLAHVAIGKSFWSGEGAIRARFAERYGKKWKPELPWVVFDRDAVLRYETEEDREKLSGVFSLLKEKTLNQVRRAAVSRGWAVIEEESPDGTDFIGVGRNGEKLALIEVKRGTANSGIYYASVRRLRDALEWEAALKSSDGAGVLRDLNALIEAKKESGLLPRNVPLLKPDPKIQSVLIVDRRDWTGQVEERRLEILKMINGGTNGKLDDFQIETCS